MVRRFNYSDTDINDDKATEANCTLKISYMEHLPDW